MALIRVNAKHTKPAIQDIDLFRPHKNKIMDQITAGTSSQIMVKITAVALIQILVQITGYLEENFQQTTAVT